MYQRIMVATDGSPLSQKAVDSALELAAAQLNEPKPFLRNAVGLSG